MNSRKPKPSERTTRPPRRGSHSPEDRRPFVLQAIAWSILALVLRVWHIGHGLPDFTEEAFVFRKALDMWPATGGAIDWNPHSFVYPSLTIYLHLAIQHLVYAFGDFQRPSDFLLQMLLDPSRAVIAARSLGVAADIVSLVAVGIIGRRFGLAAATVGMGIVAVSPAMITTSRMLFTDSVMAALALLAVHRILVFKTTGRVSHLVLAAMLVGLSAGAKYPAVLLAIPLALAVLQRRERSVLIRDLAVAAGCTAVAFLCTTPFILASWPEFIRDAVFLRDVTGGGLGKLSGTSVGYYGSSIAMNVGWLGIGLIGLATAEGLRRRERSVVLLLVAGLALAVPVASASVEAERYLAPIVVLGAVLVGAGLEYFLRLLPTDRRALIAVLIVVSVLMLTGGHGLQAASAGMSTTQLEARRWCEMHMGNDDLLLSELNGPSLLTFNRKAQVEASAVFLSASPSRQAAYHAQRPFHLVDLPLIVSGHASVHLPTPDAPEVPVYPHVVDWNAAGYDIRLLAGVDLVATSAAVRGRFEMDEERFAEQARFYALLEKQCERVATFESGGGIDGPTIAIYRMTPEAMATVASAGPLDTLWWARTVPESFKTEVESLITAAPATRDLTPGLPMWVQPLRSAYAERYRFSANDLAENLASLGRLIPAERLGAAALAVLPEDDWAIEVYRVVATRLGAWADLDRQLSRSIGMLSKYGPVPTPLLLARADAQIQLGEFDGASAILQSLVHDPDPTVARAARERLVQVVGGGREPR